MGNEYRVDEETDCWVWTRATNGVGYGRARIAGEKRIRYAHIVYWERVHGPVPLGYVLHHICHNRSCVNPAHLEARTPKQHSGEHVPELAARHAPAPVYRCETCGDRISRGARFCCAHSYPRRGVRAVYKD